MITEGPVNIRTDGQRDIRTANGIILCPLTYVWGIQCRVQKNVFISVMCSENCRVCCSLIS